MNRQPESPRVLRYQSGEQIQQGDQVRFHQNPAEIELVACDRNEPEAEWYVQEFGGGVMVFDRTLSHRFFIPADQIEDYEDLVFVSRLSKP